jgi:hypothetical protein
MGCRVPLSVEAEYRGVAAPYEFKAADGDKVNVGPKLKFEVELPDGDVTLFPVSQSALDNATPPFDAATLKRGDRVRLDGLVNWKGGEPKGDSYFQVLTCVPAKPVQVPRAA